MLQIMALKILRETASEIRTVQFYTIMTDEGSDVSNITQLVVCSRWMDTNLDPHEELLMGCAIWYHLFNLKNIKICNLIKVTLLHGWF